MEKGHDEHAFTERQLSLAEALALAGDQVMALPLFEEDGEVVGTNERSCDGHFIHGRDHFIWFFPSHHVLWGIGIPPNNNILLLVQNRGRSPGWQSCTIHDETRNTPFIAA